VQDDSVIELKYASREGNRRMAVRSNIILYNRRGPRGRCLNI